MNTPIDLNMDIPWGLTSSSTALNHENDINNLDAKDAYLLQLSVKWMLGTIDNLLLDWETTVIPSLQNNNINDGRYNVVRIVYKFVF